MPYPRMTDHLPLQGGAEGFLVRVDTYTVSGACQRRIQDLSGEKSVRLFGKNHRDGIEFRALTLVYGLNPGRFPAGEDGQGQYPITIRKP